MHCKEPLLFPLNFFSSTRRVWSCSRSNSCCNIWAKSQSSVVSELSEAAAKISWIVLFSPTCWLKKPTILVTSLLTSHSLRKWILILDISFVNNCITYDCVIERYTVLTNWSPKTSVSIKGGIIHHLADPICIVIHDTWSDTSFQ